MLIVVKVKVGILKIQVNPVWNAESLIPNTTKLIDDNILDENIAIFPFILTG